MPYIAPTLLDLRTRVARDLRDPKMAAFTQPELDDYINSAIATLNELRPIDAVLTISDLTQLEDLGLEYVWRVDSVSTVNTGQNAIPPNNDESVYQNGWIYFAGDLILPANVLTWVGAGFEQDTILLRVYGYRPREPLYATDDVAELVLDYEEVALRQYAKWKGLEALQGDRSLFQQWQTAANNTDVSPTQLTNMEGSAEAEWNRTRHRIVLIKRPAVGW